PDDTLFEGETVEAPRVEVHAEFVLRASARAARDPSSNVESRPLRQMFALETAVCGRALLHKPMSRLRGLASRAGLHRERHHQQPHAHGGSATRGDSAEMSRRKTVARRGSS